MLKITNDSSYINWLLIVCLSWIFTIDAKVLLITHSYNQPDFIRWQHASFKKFLQDDYEYVVFNDASNPEMRDKIKAVCKELDVSCHRIPQEIHADLPTTAASERHCNGIQYSLETLGYDFPGIVAIIDSDMFLVKELSITSYLEGYDIAAPCLFGCYVSWAHRPEAEYIGYAWPIIAFMNMETLPNKKSLSFQVGSIDGFDLDTGSMSYYYFKDNLDVKVKAMRSQLDINHTGFFYPFLFNLNDVQHRPVHAVLYQTIIKNQTLQDWGSFAIPEALLSQVITDKDVLNLALSSCEDIQFFENFTFLHYGKGSLYHGTEQTHSHKAIEIKKFLTQIGVL